MFIPTQIQITSGHCTKDVLHSAPNLTGLKDKKLSPLLCLSLCLTTPSYLSTPIHHGFQIGIRDQIILRKHKHIFHIPSANGKGRIIRQQMNPYQDHRQSHYCYDSQLSCQPNACKRPAKNPSVKPHFSLLKENPVLPCEAGTGRAGSRARCVGLSRELETAPLPFQTKPIKAEITAQGTGICKAQR